MTTELNASILGQVPAPSMFDLVTEPGRAILGLGFYALSNKRIAKAVPDGDKHPILVLPGFMANDGSTRPLRSFLKTCGYTPYAWGLGINLGETVSIDRIVATAEKIFEEKGEKLSIIGWSLGGVYAREVARRIPNKIRQVITLGSPFGGLFEKSNAKWLHEFLHGNAHEDVPNDLLKNILIPPPVPLTAVYSKGDGIVSWKYCMEVVESDLIQNVQVTGSHIGLGHNPASLYCVGMQLGQDTNNWKAFEPEGLWTLLYPEWFDK